MSAFQLRKDSASHAKEREELEGEVAALKHELVKAEELRMRLESFNNSLEHSLTVTNADNGEMKDQLDNLIQVGPTILIDNW